MPVKVDGSFEPDRRANACRSVTLINRLLNRSPLYGMPSPHWADVPASHWAYENIENASIQHHYKIREDGGDQYAD
ncbi:hypothetical protein ACFFSY_03190 [Paenibacillus aurantiacus]|uniref:Uncharacterized protein n=1 Tax=Paenibacillus aurantiacus TaxID=1936118 RepID=A0ABV5KI93_9BACL